jgi:hypothetical protein
VAPYYIDDTEIYQYITEAERALAVAGKWIREVRPYSIAENARWLCLGDSPEILEFKDAVLVASSGARYNLKLLGTMDAVPIVDNEADYGIVSVTSQLTPGRPAALIFGKRSGYAEISPVSNDSYTIEASLVTYPKYAIETSTDEPTIPERHHADIPIGAALMALETNEYEHFAPKIQNLEMLWQRALIRASSESSAQMRDSGTVRFNNDMWG